MSASAFDADFDYSKYDPDQVEKQVESGGMLPVGYYRAKLNGANFTTSKEKGTPCWELTFAVTEGPFLGFSMTEKLWGSDNQKMITRILLFKHRLGILTKNAEGKYQKVEGKTDFRDCLDTEVIIHVVHELRKDKDGNPAMKNDGTQWVDTRLDFGGLFVPTDPKALEKLAKQAGGVTTPAGAAVAGGTTAGKPESVRKKVDVKDLDV